MWSIFERKTCLVAQKRTICEALADHLTIQTRAEVLRSSVLAAPTAPTALTRSEPQQTQRLGGIEIREMLGFTAILYQIYKIYGTFLKMLNKKPLDFGLQLNPTWARMGRRFKNMW